MMQSLLKDGWHLSEDGIASLSEEGANVSVKSIIDAALNTDLKEIGDSFLETLMPKAKSGEVKGQYVVQVQKVRNVSVPKIHEVSHGGSSKLNRITLTDGHTTCSAIDFGNVKNLSSDTPPGSKALLRELRMEHGFLVLNDRNFEVLGGRVEHLIEKWKISRESHNAYRPRRGGADGGPPAWVAYGHRIKGDVGKIENGTFKSLQPAQAANAEGTEDERAAQFEQQRKQTIAEAKKGGQTTKKFETAKVAPSVNAPQPNQEQQAGAAAPRRKTKTDKGAASSSSKYYRDVKGDDYDDYVDEESAEFLASKAGAGRATLSDFLDISLQTQSGASSQPAYYTKSGGDIEQRNSRRPAGTNNFDQRRGGTASRGGGGRFNNDYDQRRQQPNNFREERGGRGGVRGSAPPYRGGGRGGGTMNEQRNSRAAPVTSYDTDYPSMSNDAPAASVEKKRAAEPAPPPQQSRQRNDGAASAGSRQQSVASAPQRGGRQQKAEVAPTNAMKGLQITDRRPQAPSATSTQSQDVRASQSAGGYDQRHAATRQQIAPPQQPVVAATAYVPASFTLMPPPPPSAPTRSAPPPMFSAPPSTMSMFSVPPPPLVRYAAPPAPVAAVRPPAWRVGDRCYARSWQDGKFYPALIKAMSGDAQSFAVVFSEFQPNAEPVIVGVGDLMNG